MYLLLGDLDSPICTAILRLLEGKGYNARIIANPLVSPFRFALRLDTSNSASWLTCDDGTHLSDREIEGVLVCEPQQIPTDRWEAADLPYVERENRAALLAWLWSLDCPVINRYPAALWFHPDTPLLFWQVQLQQCGLHALPSLISNAEQETHDFVESLGTETVYAPLTAPASRYPLQGSFDRYQLAAIQRHMPVHLTQAPTALQLACVVGSPVVWDGPTPRGADELELAFTRLSALARLPFLEFALTPVADGMRVAAVNAFPRIENFGPNAQHGIATAVVQLLTRPEIFKAEPTT